MRCCAAGVGGPNLQAAAERLAGSPGIFEAALSEAELPGNLAAARPAAACINAVSAMQTDGWRLWKTVNDSLWKFPPHQDPGGESPWVAPWQLSLSHFQVCYRAAQLVSSAVIAAFRLSSIVDNSGYQVQNHKHVSSLCRGVREPSGCLCAVAASGGNALARHALSVPGAFRADDPQAVSLTDAAPRLNLPLALQTTAACSLHLCHAGSSGADSVCCILFI